jgi:hypothetical protein
MRAHELAEQMFAAREAELGRDCPSEEAAELLDKCGPYIWKLEYGNFDEDEHGYVRLDLVTGFSDELALIPRVDYVTVKYRTAEGRYTKLGTITRLLGRTANVARVEAMSIWGEKGVSITPDDERWEAVTGPLKSAIAECEAEEVVRTVSGRLL